MTELVEAVKEIFNHPKYGTGLSIMAGFVITTILIRFVRGLIEKSRNK